MRRSAPALFLAVALAAGPVSAAVDVSFSQPETFTDAHLGRSYGWVPVERTMQGIEQYLRRLGERWLQPGQTLRVEVLDIDLAGRFEPWRVLDVRAMRDITWPRISLRYALEENGSLVATTEEEVADLDYLLRPRALVSRDPLRYEKAMLEDWFRDRFGESTAGDG
jgi:hypothetical protein